MPGRFPRATLRSYSAAMPEEKPVPNSTDPELNNVIESAMSRLSSQTPGQEAAPEPAPKQRDSLGRRDYDQALAHRLEQLQVAMGENAPAAPPATKPAPSTVQPRPARAATLLATALISALAGAGAMWLAIGGKPAGEPAQTRTISALPAPPPAAAEPAPAPPPVQKSDETQVRELVENWRQAWSNRDGEAYLSHYSPDFSPADGQSRSAWAAGRRKNLASRSDISVQVRDLRIEHLADQRMKLTFLQDYASGKYRENAQAKTMLLAFQDAHWRIVGEWQGAMPKPASGK